MLNVSLTIDEKEHMKRLGISIIDTTLIIAVLSLAFWMGTQAHTVSNNSKDIVEIKTSGSTALQVFIGKHTEEMAEMRRRILAMEAIILQLPDMRADIRVIGRKVDEIQVDLKTHLNDQKPKP